MKTGLLAAFLAATTLALAGCFGTSEEDLTPNRLSDLQTCTAIEQDRCTTDMGVFLSDTPEIFVTTKLNNATIGTRATCELRYLDGSADDVITVDISVDTITESLSSYLVFYFTNENPWPVGKYRVSIETDSTGSIPLEKEFRIE